MRKEGGREGGGESSEPDVATAIDVVLTENNNSANLEVRVRKMKARKWHSCLYPGCSFSTRVKGRLGQHQLVHMGLRPHTCPVCERAFRQKSNLDVHLNMHFKARPVKCRYCDRAFNSYGERLRWANLREALKL